MSTNAYPAAPAKSIGRYYSGPKMQQGLGDYIRGMIRAGRATNRNEKFRWEENREFFRGNQWIRVNQDQRSITALNRNVIVPAGRPGHNAYNHYRAMINSRVALLTKERPPFTVEPEDNDSDSIDAARQAEKFLAARWGREGWNIQSTIGELAKNGDIDGIAWLFVGWDPLAGSSMDQPIAVRADGTPINTREEFEALKAMDPNMESLWTMSRSRRPLGDVAWRVVLPNAIAVDPFAIKSFDDARWVCESRIIPRKDVERMAGRSFKEMVGEDRNESAQSVQYEDLAVEEGGSISERAGVVCHYFYAKPQPDWPNGLYLHMLDKAPESPLAVGEWRGPLPYFPYTPSPDPGHFVRSRGCGDDLKPIQRDFNQTLRDLKMWLHKVATAPVGVPRGSMLSDDYYSEKGWYEYNPTVGEPRQTQVPSEPTAVLTNHLVWMTSEMERISGISSLSQGFSAPNSPEATSGIQLQLQQTEQNMSEPEFKLKEAIEWGCNRSLDLVRDNYTVPRTVTGVGVDDAEQFKAFQGAMLRGGRFRVNGPLMPKSKAARMQAIQQFAQIPGFGDQFASYAAQLIDGDPSDFQRDVELDRRHQQRENRELLSLVTDQKAQTVYQRFEQSKAQFAEAFNVAVGQAQQMPPDPMTGQGTDPMAILASRGIQPPNLTRDLQNAGFTPPAVDPDNDNHAMELKVCNDFRKGDAWPNIDPMGQQLIREHMNSHVEGLKRQMGAMAQQQPMGQQQGSAPNPRGTPSAPKATANSPRMG